MIISRIIVMIIAIMATLIAADKKEDGPQLYTDTLAGRVIMSDGKTLFYEPEESQNVRRMTASLNADAIKAASTSTDTAQHTSIKTNNGLHKETAFHLSHQERELTAGSLGMEGDASADDPDSINLEGLHASSSSTTGSQATELNTGAMHKETESHTKHEQHELTAVAVEADADAAEEEETQYLSVKRWSGTVLRKYGWNAQDQSYAVRELSIYEYTWPACKECSGLHGFVLLQVPGSSDDDMIVMNANEMKFWAGCTGQMQDYQVMIQNTFYDSRAPGNARLMMTYIKGIQPREELNKFYEALMTAGATRIPCGLPQTGSPLTKVRPIDLKK